MSGLTVFLPGKRRKTWKKRLKRDAGIGFLVVVVYLVIGTCFGISASATMSNVIILTLFGLSFNLQFGYAGMTSLGHAMFFGLSGYVLVALCSKTGMNVWLACMITLAACLVVYALCGIVSLRYNKMTFTFLSMGIALSVAGLINKWTYMGGTTGITFAVAPKWMQDYRVLYVFILSVCVVCVILIYLLSRSPFVAMLKGSRENEERLVFLGVNTVRLRNVVFNISGLFAAIAGILFAFRNGGAYTSSLDAGLSFEAIIMCVLGGSSSFFGPVLGSLIVALVFNFLPRVTSYYQGILGIVVLLIVYFMREGLISNSNVIVKAFKKRNKKGA